MRAVIAWVWAPFLIFIGVVGPGLAAAPPAAAAPLDEYAEQNATAICNRLAAQPFLSTVDLILAAVMADTGWDAKDAGAVVGQAVYQYCPWNSEPIDRYIDVYAPQQVTAARVGGGIA